MTPARIHATLALLQLEEVDDVLRFIDLLERNGMTADDARLWRQTVLARKRLLELGNFNPAD